jgi:ABC-type spermidine/putrescine transport system permease subunit II
MTALQQASDRAGGILGGLVVAGAVVFVLSPVMLTVLLSFAGDEVIVFPPQSWGFDRYVQLIQDEVWLTAIWLSVRLAGISALVAVVVGALALLAIHRTRLPLRSFLEQSTLISLAIPVSAYAVAMYGVFAQYQLLGTFHGIVLANVVITLPFVVIVGGNGLRGASEDLELVAYTLGAPRWRVWIGVTVRMLLPAFLASFLMSFQYAFEEAVFITFLGGPELKTLPKAIFDSVQFGSDPVITAISSLIILISVVAVASMMIYSRRK